MRTDDRVTFFPAQTPDHLSFLIYLDSFLSTVLIQYKCLKGMEEGEPKIEFKKRVADAQVKRLIAKKLHGKFHREFF